jgi:transmembrane sensor
MNLNVTKDLLFDHFAGRTTSLQKKMIEEWLLQDDNQEIFYRSLAEWEHKYPSYNPQIEEPLHRYLDHMEKNALVDKMPIPERYSARKASENKSRKIWLLAASVSLLIGMAGWFYRKPILYESFATDFGETRSFLLTDGSRVTLNSNSVLEVPRFGFGNKNREVFLQGEAYFSVRHQVNHQKFVVKTEKGFDVVVLGTEFSVYARPRGSKVLLNKGKVEVRFEEEEKSKPIFLKPGELMTFDVSGHTDILPVEAEKIAAWKDHRFVFEHTEVRELIGMFADTYGLKIEIQGNKLPFRTLEGTLQAANADELLEAISELLRISVVRKGNVIILHE